MAVENANWVSAFGLLVLQEDPLILKASGIEEVIRLSEGAYRVILTDKITYNPPDGAIDGVARASFVAAGTGATIKATIYTPQGASPGNVHLLSYNAAGELEDNVTIYLTVNRFPTQG